MKDKADTPVWADIAYLESQLGRRPTVRELFDYWDPPSAYPYKKTTQEIHNKEISRGELI